MSMTRAHLERRRLDKNRDDMERKDEARYRGAAAKGKGKGKGKKKGDRSASPNRNHGDCHQFLKNGSCSRGEECPFIHDKNKAPGRAPGSSPNKKSKSKGPPRRGTSPSGKKDSQPCKNFKKGTCDKGKDCEYWHPPKCVFFQKGECRAGTKCVFIHDSKAAPASKKEAEAKAAAKPKADGTMARLLIASTMLLGSAESLCLSPGPYALGTSLASPKAGGNPTRV